MFDTNTTEEDEETYNGVYEDGHWDWDEKEDELIFISGKFTPEGSIGSSLPQIFGEIEFKDDLDLLEQQRFRKRYQRKYDADDVVTLQDVKDVVLFTAPLKILSQAIIKILHLPMADRFLRALILYCQYYLQIADEMTRRRWENETKVRTPATDKIEIDLQNNLEDLRLLVSKEYCSIIMGAGDFAKFHHMGSSKKSRSLSKRDSILFETIVRISIQIVWLALGRKSFNQIELEVHRIFKSQVFNIIEHKLKIKFDTKMTPEERFVLFGPCIHQARKLNTRSPLLNEAMCQRNTDYRIFGLGVIKYPQLTQRLRFLEHALISPESMFPDLNLTLGIIGMIRCRFDTMLREIKFTQSTANASSSSVRHSVARMGSRASRVSSSSSRKSAGGVLQQNIYKDIVLPSSKEIEFFPEQFPTSTFPPSSCNEVQRRKWLNRTSRMNAKNKCQNSIFDLRQ